MTCLQTQAISHLRLRHYQARALERAGWIRCLQTQTISPQQQPRRQPLLQVLIQGFSSETSAVL
jgi:hypothetical protein